MFLTTLCYIEKDDCYLMLHRVKKENDLNHRSEEHTSELQSHA